MHMRERIKAVFSGRKGTFFEKMFVRACVYEKKVVPLHDLCAQVYSLRVSEAPPKRNY